MTLVRILPSFLESPDVHIFRVCYETVKRILGDPKDDSVLQASDRMRPASQPTPCHWILGHGLLTKITSWGMEPSLAMNSPGALY
jgi:hypothetical protein